MMVMFGKSWPFELLGEWINISKEQLGIFLRVDNYKDFSVGHTYNCVNRQSDCQKMAQTLTHFTLKTLQVKLVYKEQEQYKAEKPKSRG